MPLLSSYRNFIKEQEASGDSTRFPEQQQDASTQQQHASQAGPLLSSSSQENSQQLQQQDEQGGSGRAVRSTRFGAGKKKKKKVHSSTRTRVRLTDLTSRHQALLEQYMELAAANSQLQQHEQQLSEHVGVAGWETVESLVEAVHGSCNSDAAVLQQVLQQCWGHQSPLSLVQRVRCLAAAQPHLPGYCLLEALLGCHTAT
ncbi:hypothetical protein OEZ86_000346 [Tetradesmus obliquus]|nr:hypothetical protein OEZ86_000346 [Tetradesmus obliquus]